MSTPMALPFEEYRALLIRYGVACERIGSAAPGRVVYEDHVQIVVMRDEAA